MQNELVISHTLFGLPGPVEVRLFIESPQQLSTLTAGLYHRRVFVDTPTVSYNPLLQGSFLILPLSHRVSFTELVFELLFLHHRCRDHRPIEFSEFLDGGDVDRPLIRPVFDELLLPGTIWLLPAIRLHDSEELCQEYLEFFLAKGLDLVAIITAIQLISCIQVPAIVNILVAECRWL